MQFTNKTLLDLMSNLHVFKVMQRKFSYKSEKNILHKHN